MIGNIFNEDDFEDYDVPPQVTYIKSIATNKTRNTSNVINKGTKF